VRSGVTVLAIPGAWYVTSELTGPPSVAAAHPQHRPRGKHRSAWPLDRQVVGQCRE